MYKVSSIRAIKAINKNHKDIKRALNHNVNDAYLIAKYPISDIQFVKRVLLFPHNPLRKG